ncbi:MAG: rhodanese-like domain-containing protein [Gemmatimonadales bacterium]
MLFKRLYDDGLAQASYLIGCAATGEAAVVDPNRDLEAYLAMAQAEGLRITTVTETHIHADFVSGSRELAHRTGARLMLSAEGGRDWQYRFAADAGAELLREGSSFRVGNIRFDVRHTPGHTPEHISFIVTDTAGATEPMGVLTGDFVFVGDVGRPDLLEKAARVAGSAEQAARTLFQSLQRFKALPDYLQIWPGHGAGSACGKGMSAVPQSTAGYERLFNWAFSVEDESEFVSRVLAGQPEPPKYFAEMKRVNKEGPRLLGGFPVPPVLDAGRLESVLKAGALVIDTRNAAAHAAGHIPGTIGIPLNRSFVTYAGWLIPYDREFYLLVEEAGGETIRRAVRDLAMIGLDRVAGTFGDGVIAAWTSSGRALDRIPEVSARDLAGARNGHAVVDVRWQAEWEAGHLPGARHVPLGYLTDRLDELSRDQPLVLQCQTGARSVIAASLLQAQGFSRVSNLAGGMVEWEKAGLPVERQIGQG